MTGVNESELIEPKADDQSLAAKETKEKKNPEVKEGIKNMISEFDTNSKSDKIIGELLTNSMQLFFDIGQQLANSLDLDKLFPTKKKENQK